jgi:post-segregation antitoxin (ccd killing protein)
VPPKPRPKTRRRGRRRKVKGAGHRGATERASHKDATAPHWRKEEREARAANARLRDWLEGAQHELKNQQQVATKALVQEQLLREENCRQSMLLLEYDKKHAKLWGELWRLRHPTDAEPEDHISESSGSDSGGSGGSDPGGSNGGGYYRWVEGEDGEWEDEWVPHENDEGDDPGGGEQGWAGGDDSRAQDEHAECPLCLQEMQETVALEPTECYECEANVQEGASMLWCETCYLVMCAQCRGTQEEGAEAEGAQDQGPALEDQGQGGLAEGLTSRVTRAMKSSIIKLWVARIILSPVSCVMITVTIVGVGTRWLLSGTPTARCSTGAIATALAFWGYTTAAVAVVALMVTMPTWQHENRNARRTRQAYLEEPERGSHEWVMNREAMLRDLHGDRR